MQGLECGDEDVCRYAWGERERNLECEVVNEGKGTAGNGGRRHERRLVCSRGNGKEYILLPGGKRRLNEIGSGRQTDREREIDTYDE